MAQVRDKAIDGSDEFRGFIDKTGRRVITLSKEKEYVGEFSCGRAMFDLIRLSAGTQADDWNERFRQLFGMTPPDDARGCLQDIHWSGGSIGYFPTYTLGNLYAAQFFAQARKDLGDLDGQFRRGEFRPLKEWLNEKIHRQGQRYRAAELVAAVTGEPLSPRFFLDHLRAKFGPLYGI